MWEIRGALYYNKKKLYNAVDENALLNIFELLLIYFMRPNIVSNNDKLMKHTRGS